MRNMATAKFNLARRQGVKSPLRPILEGRSSLFIPPFLPSDTVLEAA